MWVRCSNCYHIQLLKDGQVFICGECSCENFVKQPMEEGKIIINRNEREFILGVLDSKLYQLKNNGHMGTLEYVDTIKAIKFMKNLL